MSEELELSGNQDVSAESSPAPEAPSSENGSNDNQKLSGETQSKPQEQYVPYDRFKELIDQKNDFVKRLEEQDKRYRDLEARMQPAQPKEAQIDPKKVLERLKGIDPEFAQYNEYLMSQLEQAKAFQESSRQQQYMSSAQSIVSKLQSDLKVDPALHQSYLHQIPNNIPLDKIESSYKSLHEGMNKYIETVKRQALADYTKAKTTDAKVPGAQRGNAAPKTAQGKFQYSKDPEEARSQMVKRITQSLQNRKEN